MAIYSLVNGNLLLSKIPFSNWCFRCYKHICLSSCGRNLSNLFKSFNIEYGFNWFEGILAVGDETSLSLCTPENWMKWIKKYPGTRYDDTVIAELYFDGIDVHWRIQSFFYKTTNYTNWLRMKLCQRILFLADKGVANSWNSWNSWLSSELWGEVEGDVPAEADASPL